MKQLLVFFLFFLALGASSQTLIETKIAGTNALVWIPEKPTSKDASIFLPGLGEGGTDIKKLYSNGPFQYIKNGTLKPNQYFFAFQNPTSGAWTNELLVTKWMDSVMRRYPVDSFNLTGLSAGASAIFKTMETSRLKGRIKNIVAFSMDDVFTLSHYANVNFWGISGSTDSRTPKLKAAVAKMVTTGYNAKWFEYTGGHCCWSTYYNPTWKTNGISVYDFLWQGAKPVIVTPPVVIPPVINRPDTILLYKDGSYKLLKAS